MNNAKKEKRSLRIWVLVLLVIVIAGAVLFAAAKKDDIEAEATEPISYKTDYGELLYPNAWEEKSQVSVENSGDSSVASFTFVMENGKEVPLFDIIYGQRDAGAYLGDIRVENGDLIPVCVRSYEPDPDVSWSQDDLTAYYAMQEDVNFLINQLPLVTDVQTGEDILIETEFATLSFPGKWENQLRTECSGSNVRFYGTVEGLPEYPLFTLCFDTQPQDAIGCLETAAGETYYVSIQLDPVEREDSWSDYQMDQLMAMQEDLNHLLGKLELQLVSAENQEVTSPEIEEDVHIQTPYAELVYPGTWGEYLTTQTREGEPYTVTFLADLPGKEPAALFDVVFGQNVESPVGSLAAADGETVFVTVMVHEPVFTDDWSAEEQNFVYGMMEGMNTVLEHLPLNGN